jgi:regulator of sigma E protease
MVDEFMEGEEGLKGEPWEFQSKSTLAKIFMITAGVLMNFLAGFLIYTFVAMVEGKPVVVDEPAVGRLAPGYPAQEAGLLAGDRFLTLDGLQVDDWESFRDYIQQRPEVPVDVTYLRGSDTLAVTLIPQAYEITEEEETRTIGLIGIDQAIEYQDVGFAGSFVLGAETTWDILSLSLQSVGMLVTGQASVKDLTGPAGIVYLSGETARAGWITFISFIALISISIGLLNILPFPVLDGGHLVYILIEAVIRRPISTRVKLALQQVGLVLLLALVLVVTYHDIVRFFIPS